MYQLRSPNHVCRAAPQLSGVVLCGRTSAVGVCPIHTAERCCVVLCGRTSAVGVCPIHTAERCCVVWPCRVADKCCGSVPHSHRVLCCVVSCCVAGQVLWECAPFTQLSGVVLCCVAGQVLWECAPFTQLSGVVLLCGRTSAVGVCPIHTAERCCVMCAVCGRTSAVGVCPIHKAERCYVVLCAQTFWIMLSAALLPQVRVESCISS